MWIVRLALRRPLSVAVMALLMLVLGRALVRVDERRHLPGDRPAGGAGGVELSGAVGDGHGAPRGAAQRARLFDDRQRHRAHGVGVVRRHRHDQGVLPCRRHRGRRHRADELGVANHPAHHAARHAVAEHHRLQRRQRAGGAARRRQRDAARAGAVRLRPQLHPRQALHHRGPVVAGAAGRHEPRGDGQPAPDGAVRQRPLAAGHQQRPRLDQRHHPHRDGEDRRPRVQRRAQRQPAARRRLQPVADQGGGRHPGPARRRGAGDQHALGPDQRGARERQARHLPHDHQARRGVDAGGGQ